MRTTMVKLAFTVVLIFFIGSAIADERLARQEGSLLLYTTTPEEYMRRLTADFEKKHGVKVNLWRARSEAISQRVMNESRAGRRRFAMPRQARLSRLAVGTA